MSAVASRFSLRVEQIDGFEFREDFCIVTQSVRQGIDVAVQVQARS